MSEFHNSFFLSKQQILDIKKEVDERRLNFPDDLPNIFFKVDHLNRKHHQARATMQENTFYKLMKYVGSYLKARGFSRLVEFVKKHIVSVKEFEFCYTIETLLLEDDKEFIDSVYLALLKRPVNKDEKDAWLKQLQNATVSKENIIIKLYFTKERFQHKTKISGIYRVLFTSFFGKNR